MKRLLLASMLVIGIVAGGSIPPAANGAASAGLVGWVVNHKKKTITATVKLQIYLTDCPSGAAYCGITDAQIASYIEQNIKEAWNGHRYKCYQLIFNVSVSVVPDRWSVTSGSVGILVDRSDMQGVRSDTRHTVESLARSSGSDDWKSNDPAQRLEVTNSYFSPSTWSYPPTQNYSYAHEFGHVIGLDHYYDGDGNLISGAPDDVMYRSDKKTVSQESINRAVERSGDQLFDTDGKRVEVKDLVCDLMFKATLKGDDKHYDSANLQDTGCHTPAFTKSVDQTLRIASQQTEIRVVEAPGLGLGYVLTPNQDALALQNGITGSGRSNAAVGLFDLPSTIQVSRSNDEPATGDIPPLVDLKSTFCPGGDTGHSPPPKDCGERSYKTWLAMEQTGIDQLWPVGSTLPATLKDLGRDSGRLERLYKNCYGPTPWPGTFIEGSRNPRVTKGKLPALAAITKVGKDWYYDKLPGRIDIVGTAVVDSVDPGSLEYDTYTWTLTLCPLNADGQTPPGCP
jgi:hypothetical protein